MIFRHTISLNRVRDKVDVVESGNRLTLTVDDDASRIVKRLNLAQEALRNVSDSGEGVEKAAHMLAEAIFGEEQEKQLFEFYGNDAGAVIDICGKYFATRLGKLITKAQKMRK